MHLQMTLIYSRHIINLIPNWFDTVFLNRKTLVRAALLITKSSNPGQKHSPNFLWVSPLCHFATRKLAICFEIVQKRHIYTLLQTFDHLEGEILLLLGFPAVTHSDTQAAAAGLPVIVGWLKEGRLITKEPVYLGDSSGRLSQKTFLELMQLNFHWNWLEQQHFIGPLGFHPLVYKCTHFILYNCA